MISRRQLFRQYRFLLEILQRNGVQEDPGLLAEMRIRLEPPVSGSFATDPIEH